MSRVYDFNEFLNEAYKAESLIIASATTRVWQDIFKSNYFSEAEKLAFSDFLNENGINFEDMNESLWDTIKKSVEDMKDSKIGKAISDKVGKAIEGAKSFGLYLGDLLKKAWTKLISYFKDKFKGFKDVIKKDYEKAVKGGKDVKTNLKTELGDLKDTIEYWTVEVPKLIVKTLTGKFTDSMTKECFTYEGDFVNEMATFSKDKMDAVLLSAINEAEDDHAGDGGSEKKGMFSFLNTIAHTVAKWPPFSWLASIKELGTKGAEFIMKGFSKITANLGGPGVFEFAVISLIAGGALELYIKHKAKEMIEGGIEKVLEAEPVLKLIPMAKTIIHSLELVALFTLVVETVGELSDLEDEIEGAH
jgi:hypothetical protein